MRGERWSHLDELAVGALPLLDVVRAAGGEHQQLGVRDQAWGGEGGAVLDGFMTCGAKPQLFKALGENIRTFQSFRDKTELSKAY